MTQLALRGPAADNLLALLALLGLLRALDAARPQWHARVAWAGTPWHPVLHLKGEADENVVADAAAEGITALAPAFAFDGFKDITYSANEFRKAAEQAIQAADPLAADVLAALGSDANVRDNKGERIEATALCLIFGQGHQHFLERLERLAQGREEGDWKQIRAALFDRWRYAEEGLTFRWDPAEDRRYALGFADPSGEKIRTQPGANRLAVLGFASFPTAPAADRLRTAGHRRRAREQTLTWPVWEVPASLGAVEALLRHPALQADVPPRDRLAPLGVAEAMRARRIQTGKYFSVEPARPVLGG